MELKRGKLLQNGKYRIEGVLGQGGFGITYLAVQVGLNRKVAVKEFYMKEHCNRDADTSFVSVPSVGSRELVEGFKNKFVKEAQNIASFNHNNIIRIHDIFEENGTAYYVMEYHDCGSLSDYVTRKGRLSEVEAMFFIRQIADALAYIHELKINHLDIKPGNILLDKKNNAILIDFGLSKHYDEVGGQTTSSPVGRSKGYAPMEQYKQGGVSQFSPSTDIYSLGATMYKLVTGETPAEADEINEDGLSFPADVVLSDSVKKAIEFAMQPKRKDRPQSIDEFLRSFEVTAESKGQSDEATVIDVVDNDSVDEETVFETKEQEQERKAEEEIKRRVEAELKRMEEEERERRKEEEIKRRVEEELKRKAEEEYQLGLSHRNKKDYVKAVECFRKSAEQGHAAAQNWLGSCYMRGQGVTQDYSEAVKWYRKSAEQGNAAAQDNLGSCYYYGDGVTQDYSEAVKWYRKSAEQGDAYGQFSLALCYEEGKVVTQDYSEAVKWYRKSAEQGHASAQRNLALCYEQGQGVTQDYSEAVKWYRKSAEQGNTYGQYDLALCYEKGQGVTQDYSEAVKWYRKSAEQGNAYGQYNLALCYEKGQGVTQDIAEAMKWYKKAADNGHQDANDKVEEMTKLIAAKVHQDSMRSWSQARAAKTSQLKDQTFEVKGVKFKMIAVEGGTFQMGATSEQGSDASSNEKPVHSVTLSDYYIGETVVTQELWEAVMGNNPRGFKERFLFKLKSPQKPVEKVSWKDCKEFIEKLNQLTGKNFRLPTEAEWEYAARGGNKSKGYKYSGSNTIDDVAWYYDNSRSATHKVKINLPNELGIYDMSGNVWEWCEDWYGDYSRGSQTNPAGPSNGSSRVLRGGNWNFSAENCRVSNRISSDPYYRSNGVGFRLALSQ